MYNEVVMEAFVKDHVNRERLWFGTKVHLKVLYHKWKNCDIFKKDYLEFSKKFVNPSKEVK